MCLLAFLCLDVGIAMIVVVCCFVECILRLLEIVVGSDEHAVDLVLMWQGVGYLSLAHGALVANFELGTDVLGPLLNALAQLVISFSFRVQRDGRFLFCLLEFLKLCSEVIDNLVNVVESITLLLHLLPARVAVFKHEFGSFYVVKGVVDLIGSITQLSDVAFLKFLHKTGVRVVQCLVDIVFGFVLSLGFFLGGFQFAREQGVGSINGFVLPGNRLVAVVQSVEFLVDGKLLVENVLLVALLVNHGLLLAEGVATPVDVLRHGTLALLVGGESVEVVPHFFLKRFECLSLSIALFEPGPCLDGGVPVIYKRLLLLELVALYLLLCFA